MIYTFPNRATAYADLSVPDIVPTAAIQAEPMVVDASAQFAWDNGGDLTRACLRAVADRAESLAEAASRRLWLHIDTRVNFLMAPNWFPSIPGWHGDALPRGANGQPDLSRATEDVRHWVVLIADRRDGASCTTFATSQARIDIDPDAVWASVDAACRHGLHGAVRVRLGEVVEFGQLDLHRASPAEAPHWRFFFRASLLPHEPKPAIRRQVQVYLPSEGGGW